MPHTLAVEARFTVTTFLKRWVQTGQLTYKFSVHENALEPTRVRATFSKPTPETPAPAAVAHLYFRLDTDLREVLGFTVESETHFHAVDELRFDEKILDHVVRRKLLLKTQAPVRLSDEFSSTRVPALMREREEEKRDHDREVLEEYLLERFQRKDPYNDGRLAFHECRDVIMSLELATVSRRDREILFAFVELDRDEMVDYGAFVAIGAEVIDTLVHAKPFGSSRAETLAEAKGEDPMAEAVECFQTLIKHRQFFTMDRLTHVLDAFRPATPAPSETRVDEAAESLGETTPSLAEEADREDAEEKSESTSRMSTPAPPAELYVTRRQLRTSLESPSLLLSRAEINLMTALATTTPSGQIACSQLHELLQHVQTLVFRFQTRSFTDRVGAYLHQQFANYESSHLVGSAEHLKQRIRQREIKVVVKDMKKLLLSPLQAAQLVALCEVAPVDPDHVVQFPESIPQMVNWLAKQVELDELRELASAVHAIHQSPMNELLVDEELVRQHAIEAFEQLDEKRAGVLAIGDFHTSLQQITRAIGTTALEDMDDVAVITALADPMGQGRVNYIYFQQLVYPALRWLMYEQRVRQCRRESSQRADAKRGDDNDDDVAFSK